MPAGQVRTITVIGRVWGPDLNGNSHCGATILVNGEEVGRPNPTGGERGYLAEAFDWLERHGYILRGAQDNHRFSVSPDAYCRRKDITLHHEACRVGRKRDLA
ncbi:MAG: hypothetical protein JRD89_03495 [Deltaproteobacteria bacterium]|nr:hypothetical protein [Deltaproteobacteria bacterium]